MVEFKLTVLIVLCGLLVIVMPVTGEMYMLSSSNKFSCIIFYSAQNACHSDSPACRSRDPNTTATFFDCCVAAGILLRQASFGSGPGRACIRCATIGMYLQ